MKIALVNDMATALAALRGILLKVPEYEVIWTARDGAEAVAKCSQKRPDLILMDLFMPVMDGVEATQHIMKNSPCAILIVTASKEQYFAKVYEAMGYGALDAVDTPVLERTDSPEMATQLLTKIARIGKLLKPVAGNSKRAFSGERYPNKKSDSKLERRTSIVDVPLVAIGASTGGPKALAAILSQLPLSFSAAVAIVQHVDGQFSSGFVEWLNQQTSLPVSLAVGGERLQKGMILVAGSNDHLYLKSDLTLGYTKHPINYPYRPSVDVFFKSLSEHWKHKGTAILLTGMGRDGAEGLGALRSVGWDTFAQNKESCVVYGMPKAAVELNAAMQVLSLEEIATTLKQKFG
ncbi:chemotaxis response regulator protein-glutamate methylesterase [Ancylothrix sp. C2]|uniref:chemotaxis response regulator protein-glutamate methylesterase n=1 Tax=Ancylothrix sp. D3o TaxID=2953691 RepID=UPI0021BAF7E3|nr:chemotaxis response regulator protein-glutamate methylesterase [Ancylothrix sp. D3o]MCT7950052.1 chemotaxis response regulator protein-glutamate methylesterase [Ancylothrix sp. D3o]